MKKFTKPFLLLKDISAKIFETNFEGNEDCSSAIGLYDERGSAKDQNNSVIAYTVTELRSPN